MIESLYSPFRCWSTFGTVWLYSDPHFNDPDLPRTITAEEQIKNINSKVGKNDTLVILGDVGDINCVRRLKGYKVLVMGNHDKGSSNYKSKGYAYALKKKDYPTKNSVVDHLNTLHPECKHSIRTSYDIDGEVWRTFSDNYLFDEVYEGPLMISEKIILSHEPVDVPWAFNIHGHDHSCPSKSGHFNCCAEMINYIPVNLNQLIKDGIMADIPSIHRITINEATKRAKKRK